jgi:hypothetical protein
VLGGYSSPVGVEGVVKAKEVCVGGAVVAHDVVNTAGEGVDGTVDVACAFLVDALAFDSILLVGHSNGCFSSSQERSQW